MPALSSPRPRARRRLVAAAFVAAGLATGAAACSSPSPGNEEIADALVASGLPDDVAACAADALTDTLTEDQIAELAERGGSGAPTDDPARTDDTADKLREAMSACRALLESTSTTTTTAAPDGATTTTVAPDDGGAGGGAVSDGESIDSTPTTTP